MENIAFKGIYTAQIAQFQLLFFHPLVYSDITIFIIIYIEILLYNIIISIVGGRQR